MKKLIIIASVIALQVVAQTNPFSTNIGVGITNRPAARPTRGPIKLATDSGKKDRGEYVGLNLTATNTLIKVEAGYEPVTFKSNSVWFITFKEVR